MAVVQFIWSPERRVLVTFGVSLAATGLLVGGILYWNDLGPAAAVVAGATLLLGGVVAAAPGTAVARFLYRAVSLPAFAIGNGMSLILLTVVFYGLVTPLGFLRRALKGDPLALRGGAPTYWEDVAARPATDPERPF